jgi:hypothetical protein
MPESSQIKHLDPGVRPQGAGRGCKADKSATTTHRRGDDLFQCFLELHGETGEPFGIE